MYWKQANELLEKGEWTKASEMAWGSVVESVHALAEFQGKKLGGGHSELKDYVRGVSQHVDRELYDVFRKAETYHANFYHDFLDEQDVKESFPLIKEFLERIASLLPRGIVGGQG